MSKLTKLLILTTILLSSMMTSLFVSAEPQSVPQVKTQTPGFFRMMMGDFELTALSDGFTYLSLDKLKGIDPKEADQLLSSRFLDSTNGVQTSITAYLVNTGKNLILLDAGGGKCIPTAGGLIKNLEASGYKPSDVDTILMTHLHGDHVCGLATDANKNFPNAVVYISKTEGDFWLKDDLSQIPKANQRGFLTAKNALEPYVKEAKVRFFEQSLDMDGITIVPTPGHTPGHTSYLFKSNENTLLISGDILHSYAVQLVDPKVTLIFDSAPKTAIETRKKILSETVKNKWFFAGTHLPFPGIGHISKDKEVYQWLPVEYSPIK